MGWTKTPNNLRFHCTLPTIRQRGSGSWYPGRWQDVGGTASVTVSPEQMERLKQHLLNFMSSPQRPMVMGYSTSEMSNYGYSTHSPEKR